MEKDGYYIIPDIEELNSETDPERLRMHRRRIAANIGDHDALFAILGDASGDFHDFYGVSELPNLSTVDAIDSFLERFGSVSRLPDHPSTQETVPVVPAVDYAAQLELEMPPQQGSDSADDATIGAIDAFISHNSPPRVKPKKEPKEPETPSLSESFAKILIKNGNYSRALEIITQISLNNPEKSIYFADQIRFLRKVISIQGRQR